MCLCTTQAAALAETTSSAFLSGSVSTGFAAEATNALTLYGSAEMNDAPDAELFASMVERQQGLTCQTRNSMARLLRVANDAHMRQTVWKRMQSQELMWVSNKVLAQIERTAQLCGMPLVP